MANVVEPMPLIEYSERGELVIKDEAIAVLENIQPPIMAIGISGTYRAGKSYLANRLAGITTERKKFPLGSTVESKTKGIWFYCREHPDDHNTTVIILDSEGLDDPKKTDKESELMLLTLTLLQSTTFILNAIAKIDDLVFKLLEYVAKVSEKLKVHSIRDCDPEALKPYYPALYLVLRDCYLKEVVDGREVTGDEYLEHCLELKSGTSEKIAKYNQPRMTINACFENRNCVFLHKPVDKESDLRDLDSISKENLTADFRREMAELERKLFAEKKRFSVDEDMLDGRGWLSLLKKNLDKFKSGGVPVLRHAYDAVVAENNKNAFSKSESIYKQEMEERLKLVMETEELTAIHNQCEEDALKYFRKNVKGNKCEEDFVTLKEKISKSYNEYVEKNKLESRKVCKRFLLLYYESMIERISQGVYTTPGGFDSYCEDQTEVMQLYNNEPGKGPAADEVLEEFLKEKEGEALAIRQADINLRGSDFDIAQRLERDVHVSESPYNSGVSTAVVEPRQPEVFPVCNSSSEQAFAKYKSEMEKKMKPQEPIEANVLADNHRLAKKKSLDKFDRKTKDLKGAIKDDIRTKLEVLMESMFLEYERCNKTRSKKKCRQLLNNLFKEVDENVKNGTYSQPGGHKSYLSDRDECRILYDNEPNKGPAAEEVINKFLEERVAESCKILKADETLSENDRSIALTLADRTESEENNASGIVSNWWEWLQKK